MVSAGAPWMTTSIRMTARITTTMVVASPVAAASEKSASRCFSGRRNVPALGSTTSGSKATSPP